MALPTSDNQPNPLSIIHGPAISEESGLGALTLGGYIREVSERFANNEALCWTALSGQRRTWSYTEMYTECANVARSLITLGVGRNSRVGVLVSNRPEWIFGTFGTLMAGATAVALNTFSTRQELQFQLTHADVAIMIGIRS